MFKYTARCLRLGADSTVAAVNVLRAAKRLGVPVGASELGAVMDTVAQCSSECSWAAAAFVATELHDELKADPPSALKLLHSMKFHPGMNWRATLSVYGLVRAAGVQHGSLQPDAMVLVSRAFSRSNLLLDAQRFYDECASTTTMPPFAAASLRAGLLWTTLQVDHGRKWPAALLQIRRMERAGDPMLAANVETTFDRLIGRAHWSVAASLLTFCLTQPFVLKYTALREKVTGDRRAATPTPVQVVRSAFRCLREMDESAALQLLLHAARNRPAAFHGPQSLYGGTLVRTLPWSAAAKRRLYPAVLGEEAPADGGNESFHAQSRRVGGWAKETAPKHARNLGGVPHYMLKVSPQLSDVVYAAHHGAWLDALQRYVAVTTATTPPYRPVMADEMKVRSSILHALRHTSQPSWRAAMAVVNKFDPLPVSDDDVTLLVGIAGDAGNWASAFEVTRMALQHCNTAVSNRVHTALMRARELPWHRALRAIAALRPTEASPDPLAFAPTLEHCAAVCLEAVASSQNMSDLSSGPLHVGRALVDQIEKVRRESRAVGSLSRRLVGVLPDDLFTRFVLTGAITSAVLHPIIKGAATWEDAALIALRCVGAVKQQQNDAQAAPSGGAAAPVLSSADLRTADGMDSVIYAVLQATNAKGSVASVSAVLHALLMSGGKKALGPLGASVAVACLAESSGADTASLLMTEMKANGMRLHSFALTPLLKALARDRGLEEFTLRFIDQLSERDRSDVRTTRALLRHSSTASTSRIALTAFSALPPATVDAGDVLNAVHCAHQAFGAAGWKRALEFCELGVRQGVLQPAAATAFVKLYPSCWETALERLGREPSVGRAIAFAAAQNELLGDP